MTHDEELAEIRESTPVCPVTPPHGVPTWLVTRYDDAKALLSDPRISKDMHQAMDAYQALFGDSSMALDDNMIFSDPPKHTRLRRLVVKAFTPRRVSQLRARTQEITDELLDGLCPHEPVNLVEKFTFPVPITVICELLGVPADMRADFQRWSTTVAGTVYDDESVARQQDAEYQLHQKLVELIKLKRDEQGDDLLTDLIEARDEGDRLTEAELVSMTWLLLFAGHETTARLLGNAIYALLTHRDQLDRLVGEPRLIGSAVEEFLRFDGPAENATFRVATEDIPVRDAVITKGSLVQIVLAAANRDPRRFDDSENLDISRKDNHHLGMGHGIHYCLGASLARMEAEIAIGTLVRRFPEMKLAGEATRLGPENPAFRGVSSLPVTLG